MPYLNSEVFNRIKRRRLKIMTGVMITGFSLVIGKLAYLQVFKGEALATRAEKQYSEMIEVEGVRGVIYDRLRRELAVNLDMPSVYGVPYNIKDPGGVAKKIAAEVDLDSKFLTNKLDNKKQFVWIRRRLSPEIVKRLEEMDLKGIGFSPETKRFYPKKELIGHILGFTDIDNHGIEGIERYYERSLRGKKGSIVLERDAHHKTVLTNTLLDPLKGEDLILSIDEVIQYIMEKELAMAVGKHNAAGGVGIVMNPYTGEILAMSVHPRFNPNTPGDYKSGEWRNKAITDVYEPGSTFKFVVASGILEEGLISPNEIVHDGSGSMVYGGSVIHDPHPAGVPLTLKDVIAHSSNVGTAKIDKAGTGTTV